MTCSYQVVSASETWCWYSVNSFPKRPRTEKKLERCFPKMTFLALSLWNTMNILFSTSSPVREYPKGLCPPPEFLPEVCRNYRASTNPIFTAFEFNEVCFRGAVENVQHKKHWEVRFPFFELIQFLVWNFNSVLSFFQLLHVFPWVHFLVRSLPYRFKEWLFTVRIREVFKGQPEKHEKEEEIENPLSVPPLIAKLPAKIPKNPSVKKGDLVIIHSHCQDPRNFTDNVLIFGNFTGDIVKPPLVARILLDPCPTINWTSLDNSCKRDWVRRQIWSNCEDFIEGKMSILEISFVVVCASLILLSLVITFFIWWWKERGF